MNKIEYLKKETYIPFIIFLAAFGFLYWDTVYELVLDWYNDENYSHGFLIPFIAGYMFWQIRDRLKDVVLRPSHAGIFLVLSGLCIYLVGKLSGEYFTMRVSMLIIFAGTILYTLGVRYFRAVSVPFFYLFFMIPLPYILYDAMAFPLKLFVSELSVGFMQSISILVEREGNIIHLTGTTLEVADACSGIRSIISLLALSTALAYLTQTGLVRRLVLSVLAIPIAIFVNAIRVIGTGILADIYGPKVAEGFFHEFAGLIIFGVAIVILICSAIALHKIGSKVRGKYQE
jgi:exosortase